jgi:hypothetical protein
MSDDGTKPILFVKKKDSKKGSLWNTLTNRRIIKQHGGFDIPEGDLHAITKYHSPIEKPAESSKETNETLSDLEKEIRQLKEKNEKTPLHEALIRREQLNREQSHDNQNKDDDI